MHRFRFGVQASGPDTGSGWAETARRAEDLGYSVLTVADHLDEQFAPIPALTAAAMVTTDLRLGSMVLCNDFRHPVITAKEMATLDLLSTGRVELGLGAGWMTSDYATAGLRLDPATTRIERLAEAVEVITALLGGDPVDFDGRHYRIAGLAGRPLPHQRPRPPLLIGGGGRRILELAAQWSDIVGVNVDLRAGVIDERAGPSGTAAATDEKLGWLRAAAGDRFVELELHTRVHIAQVTDDSAGLAEILAPALGIEPSAALESPHALAGSVPQIIETLQKRRELWGISYIGLSMDAMDAMAPVVAALTGT